MRRQQDQQSRAFYELSALVLNLMRSPPSPISFSDEAPMMSPAVSSSRRLVPAQISPVGFASLLLGISLTLMLCGSVTFFLGFILMPWVIGLVMVLYVAGVVSTLSTLGRSILCYATAPSTPRKDVPGTFDYKGLSLALVLIMFLLAFFISVGFCLLCLLFIVSERNGLFDTLVLASLPFL